MLLKKIGIALAASGLSLSASAAPFFIDRGIDWVNPADDANSTTASITQLGYTGTLATSYYFGNPAVNGTPVFDTNINAAMGAIAGNYVAVDGITPVTLVQQTLFSEINVDAINPLLTGQPGPAGDTEGYGAGVAAGWSLFYQYSLVGAVNLAAGGVEFTSGTFEVFYIENDIFGNLNPLASAKKVLEVDVTGSDVQAANLNVFGEVDYSWYTAGSDAFVENFFNDSASGTSFFDIWSSNVPPPVISFVLDTNVDPPIPEADQLVAFADCPAAVAPNGVGCLVRQTTLDGSAGFSVPEPGTLALMGLGLLGAGANRRRKQA